jgi:hypothetical protein
VSAPASSPASVSCLRSASASSTTAAGVAPGEVFGRRDRGSNTASPSTVYRASNRLIQPCDTPYVRATSDCERPASTAVITNRRFDNPATSRPHLFRCLETPHSDVLKHNTAGRAGGRATLPGAPRLTWGNANPALRQPLAGDRIWD